MCQGESCLFLHILCHFFLSKTLWGWYCYLYFREENNQAERDLIICPRSHSMSIAKLRFQPEQPGSQVQVVHHCIIPTLKRKKNTAFLPTWGFLLIPGAARAQRDILADLATGPIRQSLFPPEASYLTGNMVQTCEKLNRNSGQNNICHAPLRC